MSILSLKLRSRKINWNEFQREKMGNNLKPYKVGKIIHMFVLHNIILLLMDNKKNNNVQSLPFAKTQHFFYNGWNKKNR
jgi:hypothetical protein